MGGGSGRGIARGLSCASTGGSGPETSPELNCLPEPGQVDIFWVDSKNAVENGEVEYRYVGAYSLLHQLLARIISFWEKHEPKGLFQ